jgi:hypothetical protein
MRRDLESQEYALVLFTSLKKQNSAIPTQILITPMAIPTLIDVDMHILEGKSHW